MTPSLGTSICCRCAPKKQSSKQKKKKKVSLLIGIKMAEEEDVVLAFSYKHIKKKPIYM